MPNTYRPFAPQYFPLAIWLLPCLLALSLAAPAQELSGVWKGYVTQYLHGSINESPYRLELLQNGREISGIAEIEASEFLSLTAKMRVSGTFDGRILQLKEVELLEGDKLGEGVGWCMKELLCKIGKNKLGMPQLSGEWEGFETGGKACRPGKVLLTRAVPSVLLEVVDSISGLGLAASVTVHCQEEAVAVMQGEENGSFLWGKPHEEPISYRLSLRLTGYYDAFVSIQSEGVESEHTVKLRPIRAGDVTVINQLQFAQGKFTLMPESLQALDELADFLLRNPRLVIEVAGHTSQQGDEELNQQLSYSRALEVAKYLHHKGIPKNRLVPKGFGSSQPIASNDTPESRMANRRVAFRIVKVD